MPNGSDKNVVRLCAAVDGFRLRYGTWPTTARLWPGCIQDLEHCLSPEGFANIQAKLRLVESNGATVSVEDDSRRRYDYGSEGFPDGRPDISAEDWLQPERRKPSPEELELYHARLDELRKQFPNENVWIDPSG